MSRLNLVLDRNIYILQVDLFHLRSCSNITHEKAVKIILTKIKYDI